jgi:hypothetical protein
MENQPDNSQKPAGGHGLAWTITVVILLVGLGIIVFWKK